MADRSLSAACGRTVTATQRALVVAVDTGDPQRPIEPELLEFEALATAAGAAVVARVVQRRDRVDPATLIGSGKVDDVAAAARAHGADVIVVLNDLRPRQRRNLEKRLTLPIVDRTMLILDVFARHARGSEGKLQVELAQLRFRQSNLIGAGSDLSRLGGGIGTRGPGETKLEVDRRRIGVRIAVLRRALARVERRRATRRGASAGDPFVALVGYTNVGKSSLLNVLARSDALVADRPFATLDPTIRRVYLADGAYARLADTVGFITELPKDLIEAFRATLEELRDADLLLHVVDASSADWPRQRAAVERILHDLGLESIERLTVYNKCDAIAEGPAESGAAYVSARTGQGIAELRARIVARLALVRAGGDVDGALVDR